MEYYFGEVEDGEMKLSEIGKIAKSEWFKTLELRPDMNLILNEFVVMPNHIHGIIFIGKNEFNKKSETNESSEELIYKNKFQSQSKNLASIIRGYKSAVTIQARKINSEFGWQSKFHEHIIRDKRAFQNIEKYIKNNPKKWGEDKFLKKIK